MDLVVQSPDELLAAVPHVLGFKPEESIGLLTLIPSVVLSALGLTMVGAAYLAAERRATTARRPADRLRLLLIFGTWLVLMIAAAASLT